MKIAILAVQGAFIEHEHVLNRLGVETIELREKKDLDNKFDGLILPGGESTVQGKLLKELDMFDFLQEKIQNGLPTLATCAGLILLAKQLSNDPSTYFQTLPITVKRNAYGRQLGSFKTIQDIKDIKDFPMTFIRAPYIESVEENVNILSTVDNRIVAVEYQNQIGLSFHPELEQDDRIHQYWLDKIKRAYL